MSALQHLAEHSVGVIAAFVCPLGILVIHPGIDDDLAKGVTTEEQAILLTELGAQPVLVFVVRRQNVAHPTT